jgi:hypothetical protein
MKDITYEEFKKLIDTLKKQLPNDWVVYPPERVEEFMREQNKKQTT